MKKVNEKGFTLAELLIVVAIIAVLVAVAIPTFADQLEKAREATDISNLRSAYAQIVTSALEDPQTPNTIPVDMKQSRKGWQTETVEIAGADLKGASATSPEANSVIKVVYTAATDDEDAKIEIAGVKVTGKFESTTVKGYVLIGTDGKFTDATTFAANKLDKYTYDEDEDKFTEATNYTDDTTVYYTPATFTKITTEDFDSNATYYLSTPGGKFTAQSGLAKFADDTTYYTKND